jgi:PRTRC genetic system protein E
MFFQNLFPVARHTPLSIIVSPNGTQLSVIVTPKPTGDAEDNPALANPIKIVGTPEDLDKELPAALRQYADKVNDLRTKIDLPTEALEAAAVKAGSGKHRNGGHKRSEAAKRTPAKREADAQRHKKAEDKKSAAAKKGVATRTAKTSKINLPGVAPAEKKDNKPDKPACIADLKAMIEKHGAELTRRLFIKKATTGRRYEKLWKNWEEFIDEGLPVEKAPCIVEIKAAYAKHGNKLTEALFLKGATLIGQRYAKQWKTWDAFFDEGVPDGDRIKWKARTADGKEIATLDEAPKAGKTLALEDGKWKVLAVDGFNVVVSAL